MSTEELRHSPLHSEHIAAGASFTDFGGWSMPVRYQSDLAEHEAVRSAAGLFDVSHMAEFEVAGPDAARYLDYALSNLISTTEAGQAKYTMLLAEHGGVIDDLIVYRIDDTEFLIVANAGNRYPAFEALQERMHGFEVSLVDLSDELALLALQGPQAITILEQTADFETLPLDDLRPYRFQSAVFDGVEVALARTGYTGEDGFELMLPNHQAAKLWRALLEAGTPFGLVPAGLAARDTLRLEAGLPLYGHELSLNIRPDQAKLMRFVNTESGDFVGKTALATPLNPDAPVLVGLVAEGRRAARAGYPVLADGAAIGEVVSGALSPTLGYPIAFAYVSAAYSEPGTELQVDIRGKALAVTVVKPPFYRRPAR